MDIFVNTGITGEVLSVQLRNLDSDRTSAYVGPMTETNAFGEYTTAIAVPESLAVGDYHIQIFNGNNETRRVGYMRIVSETQYHLVGDYDDLNREPTANEIDEQLDDEHQQIVDEVNENQPSEFAVE